MKLRHVLTVTAVLAMIGFSVITAAPAGADTNSDFVTQINALRSSKGLGTLVVDSRLQAEAQAWAQQMANAGAISHNPALGSTPGNWSKVGENVGVGGDVSGLMAAFIASPHHYENLVDPSFNSVGVGVAIGSDGRIYTTHDFADYPGVGGYSGAASTKPAAASTPTTVKTTATTVKKTVVLKKNTTTTTAAPAATTTTTTTAPPAPVVVAPPAPPVVPVSQPLPDPSSQIVQGLVEVGSITTQG